MVEAEAVAVAAGAGAFDFASVDGALLTSAAGFAAEIAGVVAVAVAAEAVEAEAVAAEAVEAVEAVAVAAEAVAVAAEAVAGVLLSVVLAFDLVSAAVSITSPQPLITPLDHAGFCALGLAARHFGGSCNSQIDR